MDFNHLYMQANGRIGRQTYWIAAIVLGVISIVVTLLVSWLLGVGTMPTTIVLIIWQLLLSYLAYNLMAKRFHDRNKPTTYALYVIVAFLVLSIVSLLTAPGMGADASAIYMIVSGIILLLAIYVLIELGFLRGTVGPNEYGPDPVGP